MAIGALLHERFELKSIGSGGFVGQNRVEALDGRLAPSTPADSSQLVSIDVFQESMAVIRIDLPADEETRFMVMLRVGGVWQIVLERRSQGPY